MRRVSMKRKSKGKEKKEKIAEEENSVEETLNESDNKSTDENEENGEPETKRKKTDKRASANKKNAAKEAAAAKEAQAAEEKDENGEEADEASEEDADYEVDEVVGEKFVRGVRHYLIRWKGYDESGDTWEPETTLNCPDLIKKFHDTNDKANAKKDKNNKKKKDKKEKKDSTDQDWDENEEFEVERIIEVHHKRDGKREFLVSWKGYPHSQDSWEPEENLNCADLINKFMKRVEDAREVEQHNLREKRKHTDRFTLATSDTGRRLSKRFSGKQRVQYHDAE